MFNNAEETYLKKKWTIKPKLDRKTQRAVASLESVLAIENILKFLCIRLELLITFHVHSDSSKSEHSSNSKI